MADEETEEQRDPLEELREQLAKLQGDYDAALEELGHQLEANEQLMTQLKEMETAPSPAGDIEARELALARREAFAIEADKHSIMAKHREAVLAALRDADGEMDALVSDYVKDRPEITDRRHREKMPVDDNVKRGPSSLANNGKFTPTEEQLGDHNWMREHEGELIQAVKEGRFQIQGYDPVNWDG
jgi:hypothetical protein